MQAQINVSDECARSDDLLIGLDAIAGYVGRSKPTVRLLVRTDGLPACSVKGRWMSSRSMLDRYIRNKLQKGNVSSEFSCPSCP